MGALVEQFRRDGLEDLIRSWIGTGTNKPSALINCSWRLVLNKWRSSPTTPGCQDLLSQLARLLAEIIDKLTPKGQLPAQEELRIAPGELDANAPNVPTTICPIRQRETMARPPGSPGIIYVLINEAMPGWWGPGSAERFAMSPLPQASA